MANFREDCLIRKVKENKCLYDVNSPDYRDHKIRQDTWDLIGRHLKISGSETKDCWDRLRRCFCNVRNRRIKSKPTSNMTKWKYEDLMAFLIPFMDTKTKIQNDCSSSVTSTVSDIVSESNAGVETASTYVPLCDASLHTIQSSDLVLSASLETPQSSDLLSNASLETSSNLVCNDDTDMFFLNMARMTKKLPKVEQAKIKLELSNLVITAEIKHQEMLSSFTQDTIGTLQYDHEQYFLNL